jgi:hypothetical protein
MVVPIQLTKLLTTRMAVAINTNAGAQKIVQKCHGGRKKKTVTVET